MRRASLLDPVITPIRQSILSAILLGDNRAWYLAELARYINVQPSSLQRDLASLAESGFLVREQDGNRVIYYDNKNHPLYPELKALFAKASGPIADLRNLIEASDEGILFAFIYGSYARDAKTAVSDVDLMILGSVDQVKFAADLRLVERRYNIPINATIYSSDEFRRKLNAGSHFLNEVFAGSKVFLEGTENELTDFTRKLPSEAARSLASKSLTNLRGAIGRDLADAAITNLSSDRRFATAYNAALLTA